MLKKIIAGFLILIIAAGIYTLDYNMKNSDESFKKSIEEFTDKTIEIKDTLRIKNGIFISFLCDDGDWGTAVFRRGYNGLCKRVTAQFGDIGWIVDTESFSDFGFIKEQKYTVVYSLNCPEKFKSYEIEYYNQQLYEKDGTIKPEIFKGEIDSTHFLQLMPYADWNYIHARKIFDNEGNEVPEEDTFRDGNDNTSTGSL